MEHFTAAQVAHLTGVHPKTLHYWDRSGFLVPSVAQAKGTGTRRVYSFRDIVALRAAHELRGAGVSMQALRKLVEYVRSTWDVQNPLAENYLVARGKEVFAVREDTIVDVLRHPGQCVFSFVLDLKTMVEKLQENLVKLENVYSPYRPASPSKKNDSNLL